jgi:hypothetical protein|tara:strand:+ start:83 stop:364 length:282 start_codon:yes stop_codon:yes gene_type:complete
MPYRRLHSIHVWVRSLGRDFSTGSDRAPHGEVCPRGLGGAQNAKAKPNPASCLRQRREAGSHDYAASDAEFDLFTSYFMPPAPKEGFNVINYP